MGKNRKKTQHLAVSNYTGNCKAACRIYKMKIWTCRDIQEPLIHPAGGERALSAPAAIHWPWTSVLFWAKYFCCSINGLAKSCRYTAAFCNSNQNKHITEQMTAAKHKGGDDEDSSQWRAIFYCGGQNIWNLKSVHVLPCRRSKSFYGNTSFKKNCLPTHKPFIFA